MIDMKPMFREKLVATPLYRQVEERIAAAIHAGQYRPGDRLPTDAELGATFNVSRITVRHALDRLAAAKIIRRQQGVGTFVLGGEEAHKTASLVGDLDEIHPHIHFRLIASGSTAPPKEVLEQLPPDVDGPWRSFIAVNHTARRPLSYVETFVPAGTAQWVSAEDFKGHLPFAQLIEMRSDLEISHAQQTMSAVIAPDVVAQHLDLPRGSPVIRMERVYYARTGEVMNITSAHYHPQRYRYSVRLVRGGGLQPHSTLVPVSDKKADENE